ncbi:MAG: hypothetical protein Q9164_004099 [Protoblastenia rupestris]
MLLSAASQFLVATITGDPSPLSPSGATLVRSLLHKLSSRRQGQVKVMLELQACKRCLESMDCTVRGHRPVITDRISIVPSPPSRALGTFAEVTPRSNIPSSLTASGKANPNRFTNFRSSQLVSPAREEMVLSADVPTYIPPDPLHQTLSTKPYSRNNPSGQGNPSTRILSLGSTNGTPRSSGEFYSVSNNSTETLASEYVGQGRSRLMRQPAHSRQPSSLAPLKMPQHEILMMGYAQITGSYTLDGSMVNLGYFEEVKRKGIVGGNGGGGFVRTYSTKRDSGILASLGWGNFGETFGGLLGDSGISSIKEAKNAGSTKSIPIVSAPQSILFVDLHLAPGESRSYRFRHPLPLGIPPSYRGKAMKVMYNLIIGTQRAAKVAQQSQVQHVEIPFKILPSVNGQGEILGHDLMSPHTILSDSAIVTSVDPSDLIDTAVHKTKATCKRQSFTTELTSYVERLLYQQNQSLNSGLLSPTDDQSQCFPLALDQPNNMKELVDSAILNSSTRSSGMRSANRYEITRSGDKVAVILLTRSAYRLGETVPVAVDFHDSGISCFTLHATLETSETINPALALRSKASIQRVTRRIHASHLESTISAERVFFNPLIPANATAEFITTGVNLEWKLRFEFVTDRSRNLSALEKELDENMEEVARDERGSVKAAVQGLVCETFDVTVPLRIYGSTAAFDEYSESGDFPI